MEKEFIRNFSIIAHIDHGKSTLADRLLQYTGAISKREFHDQMLDSMDLEQERGITIKASAVRIFYKANNGHDYELNLIDTPGHVDFTYEVSKSLGASDGSLLIVDASQGVEAQTVSNLHLAMERKLPIIPIINKIDLPNADLERVLTQIKNILKIDENKVILASAKENIGTEEILERIIQDIPPPKGDKNAPLQALVFDSSFDIYKGVITYIRIFNGTMRPGMKIKMMATGKLHHIIEVGIFMPKMATVKELSVGEVGYFTCNIKDPKEVMVGDTITDELNPAKEPLKGYKQVKAMVFSGIYPVNSKDFPALKDAVEKLKLSDASFFYELESSASLGMGFRGGFLGLLHMEIVQERLEREYDLNLVMTTPSVVYRVKNTHGKVVEVDNPTKLPPPAQIEEIAEPFVSITLMVPPDTLGNVMELAQQLRGEYVSTEYLSTDTAKLTYKIPLSEILVDFYDKIKSMTRGYGSMDFEFIGYVPSKQRLEIYRDGVQQRPACWCQYCLWNLES